MKEITLLLSLLTVTLSSCEVDANGDPSISGFGWLIIIGAITLLIYTGISTNKERNESAIKMQEKGMDYTEFTPLGTYVGGHPGIDNNLDKIFGRKEGENLELYRIPIVTVSMPMKIVQSTIPIESITNITVEDASSIEKRVTLGRVILVGIFALAWRKKKKNELAFLVIEWKKGKFEHATTFSFEGKDAMQSANIARNRVINICD